MPLVTVEALLAGGAPGRTIIADGAIGTELIARGVPPSDLIRANLEHPELVRNVHRDYLQAGAQLITSNTFSLASDSLAVRGTLAGICIAVEAVESHQKDAAVYVSVSPVTEDDALDALVSSVPVDLQKSVIFALETCISLADAVRRIKRIRDLGASYVSATCVFDSGMKMRDGGGVTVAMRDLTAAGADFVGANCCDDECDLPRLTASMKQAGARHIVVRPNAGLPICKADQTPVYPMGPEPFALLQYKTMQLGATVVGGCCGTTPDHIRALRNMLES
jgi:methionine synthase I (cobalamin-dependent)